jgi:gas vesicle protein
MSKLLTGFALGLIAGILIAPEKGSETRRRIADKGKDLKRQFNDFVDYWEEKFESMRNEVEEEVDDIPRSAPSYASQPYPA